MILKSTLLLLLFWVSPLYSSDASLDFERRVNNTYDVFIECSAFYSISSAGLANSGDETQSKSFEQISTLALGVAFGALGVETTTAKYGLLFDDLNKQMDGDFTHFSRLLAVYAKPCRSLVQATIDASRIAQGS